MRTRSCSGCRDPAGAPGVPEAPTPFLGGASPLSSSAFPPHPSGASELSAPRLLGAGLGGRWGSGCPKALPELVFIPLHSHPQSHGFASFFTPFDRGWRMWASGPLNNGSGSSARRSVRKEAEGRAKTGEAAWVALLRLQGGWEPAVGVSGRLLGSGRGVPAWAVSPPRWRGGACWVGCSP